MKCICLFLLVAVATVNLTQATYIHSWSCDVDGTVYNDGDVVPVNNDPCWECSCSKSGDHEVVSCSNKYCPENGVGK